MSTVAMNKAIRTARLIAMIPVLDKAPRWMKPRVASWIRRDIESSGALYMKIGQWISSRTDLFSPDVTTELQHLQSNALPMDWDDVDRILTLNGIEFDSFENTPVSSGSVACVYRAVYQGKDVAVKIQRPGILDTLTRDIRLIERVIEVYTRCIDPDNKMHGDVMSSLEDIRETITKELDFDAEVMHMNIFGNHFDAKDIIVPRVITHTREMIVMEYIECRPYTGTTTTILDVFFRQVFDLGWLHTDMHAGNIGQDDNGRIVLFDFGSVIEVPVSLVIGIKALMVSYMGYGMHKDVGVMLEYMMEYGIIVGTPSDEDRRMLRSFTQHVIEYVEITDIDQFTNVMKTAPVSQNPDVTFSREVFFMIRSFTLLEGVCKSLDDDFVIIDAIMPIMLHLASDPIMVRLKIEDDLRVMRLF